MAVEGMHEESSPSVARPGPAGARVRRVVTGALLLGALSLVSSGCASSSHGWGRFRSALSVAVVEEIEVLGFADSVSVRTAQGNLSVRTTGAAPPIPAAEIARQLLQHTGLHVEEGEDPDLLLIIRARARALFQSYAPRTSKAGASPGAGPSAPELHAGGRVFAVPAGLFLQGAVSLEIPGTLAHRKSFQGELPPPADLDLEITYSSFSASPLYLQYAGPSGQAACHRPGSFTQKTVELLGEVFGVPFLLATIRSRADPMSAFAADALSHAQVGRSDQGLLVAALREDGEWPIRLLAAQVLGRVDSRQARKALVAALDDEQWRVRQKAVEALGRTRDRRVVEALVARLDDAEWRVRQRAVETLGKMGDRRAVEALIDRLRDPEYGVRYYALVALEALRDPRAVPSFIRALDDEDTLYRKRALMALQKITGKNLGADSEAWREWWEREGGGEE